MILAAFCWDLSSFSASCLSCGVSKPEVGFQMELNRGEWKLALVCWLCFSKHSLVWALPCSPLERASSQLDSTLTGDTWPACHGHAGEDQQLQATELTKNRFGEGSLEYLNMIFWSEGGAWVSCTTSKQNANKVKCAQVT